MGKDFWFPLLFDFRGILGFYIVKAAESPANKLKYRQIRGVFRFLHINLINLEWITYRLSIYLPFVGNQTIASGT